MVRRQLDQYYCRQLGSGENNIGQQSRYQTNNLICVSVPGKSVEHCFLFIQDSTNKVSWLCIGNARCLMLEGRPKISLALTYLTSTAVAFYHQTYHPFFTTTTKMYPAFIKFTVDVSHGKNKRKAWTQQPTVNQFINCL